MSWVTVQNGVREAVRLSIGGASTEWEDADAACRMLVPVSGVAVSVNLYFNSPKNVFVDEKRRDTVTIPANADGFTTALQTTLCGNRHFTVSVKIESDSGRPGSDAVAYLSDLLRTFLRSDAVKEGLETAGVALRSINATINTTYTDQDSRRLSSSTTDLFFAAAVNYVDPTATGDYVQTVQVVGVPPDITSDFTVTTEDP